MNSTFLSIRSLHSFPRNSIIGSTLALSLLAAVSASSLSATTLYWNASSPGGGNWGTGSNWSATEEGPADQAFANGASVIITRANPSINLAGVTPPFNVVDLEIQNGLTITSGSGGNNELIVTGAGSGDLTWNGTTAGYFYLTLDTNQAWNGKITDTSSSKVATHGNEGGTARIMLKQAGAVGKTTTLALDGNAAFVLHSGTGGQTVTLGELSGTSTDALITSINQVNGRHLLIDQSTNTTYAGRIDPDTRAFTLEKAGEGRLRLTGDLQRRLTGTLSIDVSAGELYLNGSSKELGAITVSSGAVFGGTGSVEFQGTNAIVLKTGAILNPGDVTDAGIATSGILTVRAAEGATGAGLVFEGNATIRFNLEGDKIVLEGDSLIGAAAEDSVITFDFTGSSGNTQGTIVDLIDFGGTSQGIALSKFTTIEGWDGVFLYGGDGNLLQFQVTGTPIPEPSSAALWMGIAASTLLFSVRHRHPRVVAAE